MDLEKESDAKASQYKKIRELGKGGGGVVYLMNDLKRNKKVAMKVSRSNSLTYGIPMEYVREMKFFTELAPSNHPNILRLYDCYFRNNKVHLILEYCNGDLLNLIRNKSISISIADIKAIMFDVLSPLQLCHSRYIAHRDIKPENYLIGEDNRLRLSDFGLSRYVGTRRPYTANVQTLMYRAPEVLMGSDAYTTAVDIWSAGCIFGSLLLRAPLFLGENNESLLFSIFYLLGTPTKETWPEMESLKNYVEFVQTFKPQKPSKVFPGVPEDARDLLYRMLDYNPATRITAEEALQHPFFTNKPEMTPFKNLPYYCCVSS